MKKTTFLLIAIISMAVIQSCQSTKSATSARMLKFNFEKGKGYDYEMILNTDQEVMGQTVQMDMTTYYSMDVTDDDGSTKTITSTFDRFKMNMMGIEVDSDKPLPSIGGKDGKGNPMQMLNRLMGAIKGKQFAMKVNPEGKVLEVSGLQDMAKSIVDSMGVDEKQKEQMMARFTQQFNDKSIKEQFERVLYIFPNKEVKVGDSWKKTTSPGGPMGGNYISTYTVKEIEGDMVTLDEKSIIDNSADKSKISGEITGTLVIDSKTGLVVNADQDMNLTTVAEGRTMKIKGKTKIKGKAR